MKYLFILLLVVSATVVNAQQPEDTLAGQTGYYEVAYTQQLMAYHRFYISNPATLVPFYDFKMAFHDNRNFSITPQDTLQILLYSAVFGEASPGVWDWIPTLQKTVKMIPNKTYTSSDSSSINSGNMTINTNRVDARYNLARGLQDVKNFVDPNHIIKIRIKVTENGVHKTYLSTLSLPEQRWFMGLSMLWQHYPVALQSARVDLMNGDVSNPVIAWSTDLSPEYFILQSSDDDVEYFDMVTIQPNENNQYEYTDFNVSTDKFYKIKAIENGKTTILARLAYDYVEEVITGVEEQPVASNQDARYFTLSGQQTDKHQKGIKVEVTKTRRHLIYQQ